MATPPRNRARMTKDGSDRGGYPADQTTRDYLGSRKGGAWVNSNGTQVGYSKVEDDPIRPMKSTGDTPSSNLKSRPSATQGRVGGMVAAYMKQRRQAGTKGY